MIGFIAVMLFIGADLAVVVAALLWLSERRSESDITNLRHRRKLR